LRDAAMNPRILKASDADARFRWRERSGPGSMKKHDIVGQTTEEFGAKTI